MAYTLTLDPPAVAQSTARTQLALNSGPIRVDQKGVDFGDAQIQTYLADRKVGSTKIDFRVPNRKVAIPLGLGMDGSSEEAARAQLQQKVGLLQREGGVLLRQRTGGLASYLDVIDAVLTLPDRWGEAGGVEPDVQLILECLPDFYGDEITLDAITGTGRINAVLKQAGAQAVIAGDHAARCRIVVTDTSGNSQLGVFWAARARHYDPAATAALFYEAEALTPEDAAATFVHAGASGGSTMRHNSLPAGSWCPVLLTDLLAGAAAWTHQGSYQIWARVYSATATPQLRLLWGVGDVTNPATNQAVQVPGTANFYLVSLGTVRLDAPPAGNYAWHGLIQALAVKQGDPVEIDAIYLQPLDESSGQLAASAQPPSFGVNAVKFAGAGAVSTTIAAGSNGAVLPQATINVASTAGFAPAGTILIATAGGTDTITYTGLTATTFTGCTGGTHTMATGNTVSAPPAGSDDASTGTLAWTNPANINAEDGATTTTANNGQTHYLKSSTHGFAIPTGATISGIQVDIKRGYVGSSFGGVDAAVRLVKATAVQATDKADTVTPWPTPLLWRSYGGPTDLWGGAWTPADINNSGFGAALSATFNSFAGVVDAIRITVFYTTSGGFATSADSVIYANRTSELRTDGMVRQDSTGTVEGRIANVTGELPRLPASGIENRAVELLVKPSRGDLAAKADAGLDAFSAQVFYRPTWLFRP